MDEVLGSLLKSFTSCHSRLRDCVIMSLRGRATTEAISYLSDIIEIATFTVVNPQWQTLIATQSLRGNRS
jgi:hypothetical protein